MEVDRLGIFGQSALHRLSVHTKLICGIAFLLGLIIAQSFLQLLVLSLPISLAIGLSGLSPKDIASVVILPVVFSVPFALTLGAANALIIPLRASAMAVVLFMLLASTPYPQLLMVLSKWLPQVLLDGLWMTYRIFFLLIDGLKKNIDIIRLRGGFTWGNIAWSIGAAANLLGVTVLSTLNVSERVYQAYLLRGYKGQFYWSGDTSRPTVREWVMILATIVLVVGVSLFV